MATSRPRIANNQEESSTKMKKNLDNWKLPKVPVDQVYKKKPFRLFPSYTIKDFEETITLKSNKEDVSYRYLLLTKKYLEGFVKKQHEFLHLGLVQIAIKPLMRDCFEAPIIVCLRDGRHREFKNSLLAIVESNVSQGPFYFNCFPSFSVSSNDVTTPKALTLHVKTSGIPLALTYRIVCKAMVNLSSKAFEEPTLVRETTYFQAKFENHNNSTKWDEVQVPESWTQQEEPQAAKRGNSFRAATLPDGRVMMRFPSAREASD